jgi:ribonuclease P protein component
LYVRLPSSKMVSEIPVVRNRVRRMSWSVGRKALDVLEEVAQVVVQRVLVALQNGQLHTFVCPQAVESCEELFGHWLFGANVGRGIDELRISLRAG